MGGALPLTLTVVTVGIVFVGVFVVVFVVVFDGEVPVGTLPLHAHAEHASATAIVKATPLLRI
jgi:hypothetical protein